MDDQSACRFVQADDRYGMRIALSLKRHHKADAMLDEQGCGFSSDREETNGESAFLQPFRRSPFGSASESNLRSHCVWIETLSKGSQGGSEAGRKTSLVFLNGARERQTDAASLRILAKICQNLAIKGDARFLRPSLHLGMVVG